MHTHDVRALRRDAIVDQGLQKEAKTLLSVRCVAAKK
jgi:hypothetical protein